MLPLFSFVNGQAELHALILFRYNFLFASVHDARP